MKGESALSLETEYQMRYTIVDTYIAAYNYEKATQRSIANNNYNVGIETSNDIGIVLEDLVLYSFTKPKDDDELAMKLAMIVSHELTYLK